jgi:hypothetical protein
MATKYIAKQIITPPFIGSYVTLFQPRQVNGAGDAKYSVQMLFDKHTDLKDFKAAVLAIATEAFGPKAGDIFGANKLKLHSPLRDGDAEREDRPEYAGKVFANASSKRKPGLVDRNRDVIISEEDCYSGCTMRASVGLFSYDTNGNKGVGVGLNNIQVIKKGPHLDGRKAAEDEFEAIEGEDDLEDLE